MPATIAKKKIAKKTIQLDTEIYNKWKTYFQSKTLSILIDTKKFIMEYNLKNGTPIEYKYALFHTIDEKRQNGEKVAGPARNVISNEQRMKAVNNPIGKGANEVVYTTID
jgi:hypothetical protein